MLVLLGGPPLALIISSFLRFVLDPSAQLHAAYTGLLFFSCLSTASPGCRLPRTSFTLSSEA